MCRFEPYKCDIRKYRVMCSMVELIAVCRILTLSYNHSKHDYLLQRMADFGELVTDSGDDHSTSSGTSPSPPPTKKSKKPAKKLGKTRTSKSSSKSDHSSERRKRIRVTTSSSSGSAESLASTESSSSDRATYKGIGKPMKCRKKLQKFKLASETGRPQDRNRSLLSIFQKHYEGLVALIESCPVGVSTKLFSRGLISEDTLSLVITGQDSQLKKAALLLCNVRAHLKVNPEMLSDFVKLLQQEKSFDFLTNQMKGKYVAI